MKRPWTDRKMASCPTAMRVWTLGRIKSPNLARRANPPRRRPPRSTLAATLDPCPTSSVAASVTIAAAASASRVTTTGLADLTAFGCIANARPPGSTRRAPPPGGRHDRRHLRLRRAQGPGKGAGAVCRNPDRAISPKRSLLCKPAGEARGGGMVCRSVGAIQLPAWYSPAADSLHDRIAARARRNGGRQALRKYVRVLAEALRGIQGCPSSRAGAR